MNIAKNYIPNEDKSFYPRDPPWLTKNCKVFYKTYRRKYKRYICKNSPPAEKPALDEMKNEYNKLVQSEKEKYIFRLGAAVSDPRTGVKKYWTCLKKLLNKSTCSIIPPILHVSLFITDIKEKCVIFNEYFKNQCTVLHTSSTLPHLAKSTNLSINKIGFTKANITEHIRKLNINKAHGHDGIT